MFSQKKPYSAVTVTVERLTSESYEEDDLSGIPDLVEVIKLQPTGPTEAARAIRKKLKYGSVHRQLRALTLLDGLIENAGPRFQKTFADEPLLERLRFCGTSELSDPDVKKKCSLMFRAWAVSYANTPGLEGIARLHKQMPRRKQAVTQDRSKVIRETENNPFTEEEAAGSRRAGPSSPVSLPVTGRIESFSSFGSSKDKKKKDKAKHGKSGSRSFNLAAEQDQMKSTIAESSIAATNLTNALQSVNREIERVSHNATAVKHFEACKQLRRKILRYIHYVESEDWLGSLLHANDELITALMTFEQLDRSIDADSDSEDDMAEQAHAYRMASERAKQQASPTSPSPVSQMAGLSISRSPPPPPRPSASSKPPPPPPRPAARHNEEVEDDDDDPFADSNALPTPGIEKSQPKW
ncbi:hypothetical protein MCOR25_006291 [Pyricularia grisea]|nr:hypothetical protein MCOR25_006291 [Pyricularia grisea]